MSVLQFFLVVSVVAVVAYFVCRPFTRVKLAVWNPPPTPCDTLYCDVPATQEVQNLMRPELGLFYLCEGCANALLPDPRFYVNKLEDK